MLRSEPHRDKPRNPPYIEEAVDAVRGELASLPGVDSLVLFGSASRSVRGAVGFMLPG